MSKGVFGSVRVGYVHALLDYLKNHDVDARKIYDADLLRDLEAASFNDRFPIKRWGEMLARSITYLGDDSLPLRVAQELKPKHWGTISFLGMSCATLADVVGILERFEQLVDEVNDTWVTISDDLVELEWVPLTDDSLPAFMQICFASWISFARTYTGIGALSADVHFSFPEPKNTDIYIDIFGGNVSFDQKSTRMVIPRHYLDLTITHHDADMHRLLLLKTQSDIVDLKSASGLQETLQRTIAQHLLCGRIRLEHLAETLNMPIRTLQHRLREQNVSYRTLLDKVRLQLARQYLSDPALSIVQVAELLGYSEQSPFQNAFKRWSGVTPGDYRKSIVKEQAKSWRSQD